MALELTENFSDINWYARNKELIEQFIFTASTYYKKMNVNEFWLKDKLFNNDCEFDVRIFLNSSDISIEVTAFSNAFYKDIKHIHEHISLYTEVVILDDDGEEYKFE